MTPKRNLLRLAEYRRSVKGRRGLRRKPPRWLFPWALESRYEVLVKGMLEQYIREIDARLVQKLPEIVQSAKMSLPHIHGDDFVDDIEAIKQALIVAAASIFGETEALAVAIATQVQRFNGFQFRRVINATLGVDPIGNDPQLQTLVKAFSKENAKLVKSIPDKLLDDVAGIAYRGLTGGATVRDMEKDIRERFGVTRKRARLIARTEVAKLNSQMTEARQRGVGIEEYIWRDAQDERVRPSHAAMEGLICRWDDPTVCRRPGSDRWISRATVGGVMLHPGRDYQCRCYSEPIIEELIGETG